MGGKKSKGSKGGGGPAAKTSSNSFAALADADEEVEVPCRISKDKEATSNVKVMDPLVWIDLEMTGLDIDKNTIIEIAVIVTDGQLSMKIEGPEIAIHATDEVLAGMNEWCIEHHGKSGLTQRVKDSKIGMAEAEARVLDFVKKHVPAANTAQLAGNSVHVDRMFLNKYMPKLVEHLHYRIVDVSTIKELARRWYPSANRKAPKKVLAHTALSDIRESISEMEYWRRTIFVGGGQGR